MERKKAQIHQIRVGSNWIDPIVIFLKDDILPRRIGRAIKCGEKLLDFGCPKIKSCASAIFLDCYTFILKQ